MPDLYAQAPSQNIDISDCSFYQTIDIPGYGVQPGQWDLRDGIKDYLGELNFTGKRVLEIGTANGFVCFEIERRGADVVAFDLAEELTYDAPPFNPEVLSAEAYREVLSRIRNAWWLTHRALGSRAKVAYGHANRIPATLGVFDIGVMANVLQHLQDPMGALMGLAAISKHAIVVTETDWLHGFSDELVGMIYLEKDNPYCWYQVKPPLVEAVLRKMGFSKFIFSSHKQLFKVEPEHTNFGPKAVETNVYVPHFTIVATRE